MIDPGTAELDALLERMETQPEWAAMLRIPITPNVIRWLLRGAFVREDGTRAKIIGGTIMGTDFTPYFREER